MKAIITVDMNNAAFENGSAGTEFARILRKLAEDIDSAEFDPGNATDVLTGTDPLIDVNGNTVGTFQIIDNVPMCIDCGDEIRPDQETMARNNGALSHLNKADCTEPRMYFL